MQRGSHDSQPNDLNGPVQTTVNPSPGLNIERSTPAGFPPLRGLRGWDGRGYRSRLRDGRLGLAAGEERDREPGPA